MTSFFLRITILTCAAVLTGLSDLPVTAAEQASTRMDHPAIKGTEVWISYRFGSPTNTLHLKLSDHAQSGKVTIPRLCGRLKDVRAVPAKQGTFVGVHPEPEYWTINWKGYANAPESISLVFEQPPVLPGELAAVTAAGDGSFMLHAWQAATSGEKLRYEPQTHKNTVGYWVGKNDAATWTVAVEEPGEFNVGILQGCGSGQGGSTAALTVSADENVVSTCEFQVQETGHFQNFQWRTVGTLSIREPGTYQLQLAPKQIKKNALMDCRAINLVKLPVPKKK